ncbi:TPM domain-containing protein [Bacillus subtilis]|uniref:TPM domain-containing protein n=1 Tax=Pseudochrobactrum asaccharolyticum TaxID=354351 RepID=UPI001F16EC63|nr:TPM domain-containing protein [Pseudochrobactrum asaccharolyticum]MCF7646128.1 TPM domain-containing protein [Pseudochrobactrum asaccharolyticum]MCF7672874.1 TPM domain-containing protein [Bacillus subtilis]
MTQYQRNRISPEDRQRIGAAIRNAEAQTGGEIYAVLAQRSDDYFYVSGFIACCGMIVTAVIAAFVAHYYWFDLSLPKFALAILAAFICLIVLLALIPALRMVLVPHRVRYRRAHLNALQQFVARNVHLTSKRTGILLFVSLAERYAEVVADAGINARVDQQEWNTIVATLSHHAAQGTVSEGFIEAIDKAGKLLAQHFPKEAGDENELEDHLVEL